MTRQEMEAAVARGLRIYEHVPDVPIVKNDLYYTDRDAWGNGAQRPQVVHYLNSVRLTSEEVQIYNEVLEELFSSMTVSISAKDSGSKSRVVAEFRGSRKDLHKTIGHAHMRPHDAPRRGYVVRVDTGTQHGTLFLPGQNRTYSDVNEALRAAVETLHGLRL